MADVVSTVIDPATTEERKLDLNEIAESVSLLIAAGWLVSEAATGANVAYLRSVLVERFSYVNVRVKVKE